MGVDWLDLHFRLEREFGITLTPDITQPHIARLSSDRPRKSVTAGEVLEMVVAACSAQDRPVPPSAWTRVKRCIAQTGGVSPKRIRQTSLLNEDLGLS